MWRKIVLLHKPDCGTERYITVRAVVDGGNVISPLGERILGRTTAEEDSGH